MYLVEGSKWRFLQIFVKKREDFPIIFIQSKHGASTHEHSKSSIT